MTKVAVIGAGAMAREHIRAFRDMPGVSVVGIYSRTPAKAETLAKEFAVPHVCASVAQLYERTTAELVVVAVPELSARTVSEACFAYPWGVLMEKPAGYNLVDARAILDSATKRQRRVWVGLNRRFLSSTQAVIKDLGNSAETRYIHVQDQQSLAGAATIGHPREVVDNWMFANSIHLVDYLCLFGRGGVKSVQRPWLWQGADTRVMLAAVEFHSGDLGVYEGIWQGPGPWAVSVTTLARRWELRPLEQAAFQNAGERRLQQVEIDDRDKEFKPGFRLQAQAVVNALRGEPSEAPTLEQAMATMRLIADIFDPIPD